MTSEYHGLEPPINMSNTWIHGERSYLRDNCPNTDRLCSLMCQEYNCDSCVQFPSGIAAISAVMNLLAGKGKTFLIGSELYDTVYPLIDDLVDRYEGFIWHEIDVNDTQAWVDAVLRYKPALCYMESCSNPSGQMPAVGLYDAIKTANTETQVVVDNTWLTGVLYNPIKHGADLVVESISKYHSNGYVIMGAVVGNDCESIREYTSLHGQHVSSFDAWIVSTRFDGLESRLERSSRTTLEICKWLETQPWVNRVLHPLLESHPSYVNNIKLLPLGVGPSVLLFHVSMSLEEAHEAIKSSALILYATSYGKPVSHFNPFPFEFSSNIYDIGNSSYKSVPGSWIRLAIGYESSVDKLKAELDSIFG